jgi:uncharacterized protein (TIGR03382 family)
MMKAIGFLMLLLGASGAARACAAVPEIDAASGVGALVLLSGALLVLRARRKQ